MLVLKYRSPMSLSIVTTRPWVSSFAVMWAPSTYAPEDCPANTWLGYRPTLSMQLIDWNLQATMALG